MKKYAALLLFNIVCLSNIPLKGMDINDCKMEIDVRQNPMDPAWFYNNNNIFKNANQFHEYQYWNNAVSSYEDTICRLKNIPEKDKILLNYLSMALLNAAACLMAQQQATKYWSAFDSLIGIPEDQQISNKIIKNANKNTKKTILVKTNFISVDDIVCFLPAVNILEGRTKWNIILEVPKFLIKTLETAADTYKFNLYSPQIIDPSPDYETHLISLLGHLKLTPASMNPEKVIFTALNKTVNIIANLIKPTLKQNHYIAAIDTGEMGRKTTTIGGRQLNNSYLDRDPFKKLLNNHLNLTLLDCSKKFNQIVVRQKQQNRYLKIPEGVKSLDMLIALGHVMNNVSTIIAFVPNMGHTNVLIRSLNHTAQKRMAIIIPDAKEHDIRMSGEGSVYKHMLSHCNVYKCNTPNDQTDVIELAYQNMIKNK